jgi:hypothetical protein
MSTPYRLWEILQRSYTGPHCEEDDFLPKIFTPKLQEVIKKYEITYNPDNPVPVDDDLSDRVWQAGWELFRDVKPAGSYFGMSGFTIPTPIASSWFRMKKLKKRST